MGHGVPIDPSGNGGIGAAGPYMLPVGFDSTTEIARSWSIAPAGAETGRPVDPPLTKARPARSPHVANPAVSGKQALVSGVQKIIEDALRAAGLMK